MSLKGKIKRAQRRAESLQKRADKKKAKGKDEKAKKLEAKAATKRGKAAGLAAGKAAMMGVVFGVSDPMKIKKSGFRGGSPETIQETGKEITHKYKKNK